MNDATKQKQLDTLRTELADLQGEEPLVYAMVDDNTIAQVIANWTGIPVGNMMKAMKSLSYLPLKTNLILE